MVASVVSLVVVAIAAVPFVIAKAQSGTTRRAPSAIVSQLSRCVSTGRPRPTVVLVHGAWADASSWSGEVASLQQAGYVARAIANPLESLTTDSETVADFLKSRAM
ncbi:hypothetical protein [Candidatus Nephthysia bennettiae]|uniref:hypothetical protein n=1 Tax=Candidatus Nephthysia bennettiae TaxID=3127016 RepID=UPI0030C752BC